MNPSLWPSAHRPWAAVPAVVTSQGLFLAEVCAAAVVVSLPVLIAGFAAQDKLVWGLSSGSIK